MEKVELNVEARNEMGKGNSRRLREQNWVPGIFYGPHQKEPIAFSVKANEIRKILQKGGNIFLNLKGSNLSGKIAVIKDEQFHPVTGSVEHIDLYEVRMDEEIKVSVKVVLTGKAKGIGEGGILQQITRELPIRCLPDKIPESISVDVSHLDVGFSIHVDEVKLPEGVKVVGNVNYTIAAVVLPAEEEVAAPVATAEGAAAVPGAAAPAAGAAPAPGAAPAAGAKPAAGAAPAAGAKGAAPAAGAKPAAGAAPAAGAKAPAKDAGKK